MVRIFECNVIRHLKLTVSFRMNCVSLDTIGLTAFGHDFGALYGKYGAVEEAFDMLGTAPPRGLDIITSILGPFFPFLLNIPTTRQMLLLKLNTAMQGIAEELLKKTREEVELGIIGSSSRSIMGALSELSHFIAQEAVDRPIVRAENAEGKSSLTEQEVVAQVYLSLPLY